MATALEDQLDVVGWAKKDDPTYDYKVFRWMQFATERIELQAQLISELQHKIKVLERALRFKEDA